MKKNIKQSDEQAIKIHGLFVYPIRGIRSPDPLPEIYLSEHGVKYDRELILISKDKLKHVTTTNSIESMSCLT